MANAEFIGKKKKFTVLTQLVGRFLIRLDKLLRIEKNDLS